MPAVSTNLTRDEELFLIIERDIPQLNDRMDDLEDSVKEVSSKISDLDTKINTQNVELKSIKDGLDSLNLKKELPWYQDFQKLLILLFAIGFMILAGVRAYEGLVDKVLPTVSITEEGSN